MSQPLRRDSYRNPNGLRGEAPRSPGRGRGTGRGWVGHRSVAPAREPVLVPPDTVETADARATWQVVVALAESSPQLRADVVDAWLRPVRVAGERNGRVVIAAPTRISERLRRRFGAWLGDAVRRSSAHTGIELYDEPDEQRTEVAW